MPARNADPTPAAFEPEPALVWPKALGVPTIRPSAVLPADDRETTVAGLVDDLRTVTAAL